MLVEEFVEPDELTTGHLSLRLFHHFIYALACVFVTRRTLEHMAARREPEPGYATKTGSPASRIGRRLPTVPFVEGRATLTAGTPQTDDGIEFVIRGVHDASRP